MAQTSATGSRERIADAALSTFAERGFHATTTRDIAAAAGMSPAALYLHHSSKEELLYTLSLTGHLATLELLTAAAESEGDPTAQLSRMVHDFVVDHARNHVGARVVNYELGSLSAEHRVEIDTLRGRIDALFRDVIRRGALAEAFRVDDVHLASTAVLSLGLDVARWYRSEGGRSPEALGTAYAQLALRLVGAAP